VTETSTLWKRYENSAYGYSIDYPSRTDLRVPPGANSPEAAAQISFVAKHQQDGRQNLGTIELALTVGVFSNPDGLSPQDWVRQAELESDERGDQAPLSARILSRREVTIGTLQGLEIEVFSFDAQYACTYASHSEAMVQICYPTAVAEIPNQDFDPMLAEFRRMVETFRILED
jgi:hypothetical protein